jgi:tetratricopeptide (TPR) repeat protein
MEKEKESKIQPTVISTQPPEGIEKETSKNTSPSKEVLDDPFIRQTLADIYAKQGLYMEALKIYERILNDEPDNHDVKEKLRDILRMKGI